MVGRWTPAAAGARLMLEIEPHVLAGQMRWQAWSFGPSASARFEVRRPQEHAVLEPLGEHAEAGVVPVHDFDEIALPAPEHEQMARERVLPQDTLDQHGDAVDAFAHVYSHGRSPNAALSE